MQALGPLEPFVLGSRLSATQDRKRSKHVVQHSYLQICISLTFVSQMTKGQAVRMQEGPKILFVTK